MLVEKNILKNQINIDYLEELELYERVLNFVMLISSSQHGIQTDGRGVRAVKIFTRQTQTALSLNKLFPKSKFSKRLKSDLWDISSIASLTRNLIEGYLSLNYFGTEKISEKEAELRFLLLQLHKNKEWLNIRKDTIGMAELQQFTEGIPEQKNRLKNHEFFSKLSRDEKKRVIEVKEMYKTKTDFEINLLACKNLNTHYRLLSNFVHALPLSFERIDNEKGRGFGTDSDVSYCLICIMLARKYLAATVVDLSEHFKTELANKFQKEFDDIKPLVLKGFT